MIKPHFKIAIIVFLHFILGQQLLAQESKKDITLYWDASSSMSERNLEAEIAYLDAYFTKHSEVTLNFKAYSDILVSESIYTIQNGNWEKLKETLQNTVYDGASNGALLNFKNKSTQYILSTDGFFTSDVPTTSRTSSLLILTSTPALNIDRLVSLASKDTDEVISLGNSVETAQQMKPNRNAIIGETQLLDNSSQGLDEVLISGKAKEGTEKITTGYGEENKDAVGYDVKSVTGKQIGDVNTDVSTAIQGQFAGVQLNRNADLSRLKIRTVQTIYGNQYALIVIDGIPQQQANSAGDNASATDRIFSFINPEEIEKITVLKSLSATNKYGSLGVNGVVEIKTNRSSANGVKTKKKRRGTTATFSGNTAALKELPNTPYIQSLKTESSVENAYSSYQELRSLYGNNPSFYLNVSDYFKIWNTMLLRNRIRSNINEFFSEDAAALRGLAFSYDASAQYNEASIVLEKVLELAPKQIQSYRDLAISYENAGEIDKSFEIYKKVFETNFNVPLGGLKDTFEKEYCHFIAQHKDKIKLSEVSPIYKKGAPKLDSRILVEWDDPSTQFDINIINPQNRFFTWEHTTTGAAQRLASEKSQGFASEEFFLTAQDKGVWKFNVIYRADLGLVKVPTRFLKFTLFRYYGTPQETREVKIVRLDEVDEELTAFKIKI